MKKKKVKDWSEEFARRIQQYQNDNPDHSSQDLMDMVEKIKNHIMSEMHVAQSAKMYRSYRFSVIFGVFASTFTLLAVLMNIVSFNGLSSSIAIGLNTLLFFINIHTMRKSYGRMKKAEIDNMKYIITA